MHFVDHIDCNKEHNYVTNLQIITNSENVKRGTINEVANAFRGGGHAYASGATLESLDELKDLIEKLKEKMNG